MKAGGDFGIAEILGLIGTALALGGTINNAVGGPKLLSQVMGGAGTAAGLSGMGYGMASSGAPGMLSSVEKVAPEAGAAGLGAGATTAAPQAPQSQPGMLAASGPVSDIPEGDPFSSYRAGLESGGSGSASSILADLPSPNLEAASKPDLSVSKSPSGQPSGGTEPTLYDIIMKRMAQERKDKQMAGMMAMTGEFSKAAFAQKPQRSMAHHYALLSR